MSALLQYAIDASWIECYSCGVNFAISDTFKARLKDNHNNFYCPNGHIQHFTGETEAQRVKREMQATIDAATSKIEWLRSQAETARRGEIAAKSKLTKMKNRVEAGVCPHCNRTFKQLAAHMKCKHPELLEQTA